MKLSDIIQLKVDATFKYKGATAKVLATRFKDEIVWQFRDGTIYRNKSFEMYFSLDSGEEIVLSSSFPDPKSLNLPDYLT